MTQGCSVAVPPSRCSYCEQEVTESHWFWMNDSRYLDGGRWRCHQRKRDSDARCRERVKANPVRLQRQRERQKVYHLRNPEVRRFKAYKSSDKMEGRESDLSLNKARSLMDLPCIYCGAEPSGGLDRRDSSLGHTVENVVPACEKCNFILGDIPEEAKDVMAPSLKALRERGLLDHWVIPTKRGQR